MAERETCHVLDDVQFDSGLQHVAVSMFGSACKALMKEHGGLQPGMGGRPYLQKLLEGGVKQASEEQLIRNGRVCRNSA